MATEEQKPLVVGIVGGGIGGFALAQALSHNVRACITTVFERDADSGARDQGYQIGINVDGFNALKEARPELDMNIFDRDFGITSITLADTQLNVLLNFGVDAPDSDGHPGVGTVNRWAIRRELSRDLLHGQPGDGHTAGVLFNKRFLSYSLVQTPDEGEKVVALFEDGTDSGLLDILVGADGARSPVRAQLFPAIKLATLPTLNYGAVVSVDRIPGWKDEDPVSPLRSIIVPPAGPSLVRLMDRQGGSLLLLPYSDRHRHHHLIWALTMALSEEEGKRVEESNEGSFLTEKILLFARKRITNIGYHPDVQALVQATKLDDVIPLTSLDATRCHSIEIPPNFQPGPTRVVLLGDAAHATTTQGGLGANTALQDAVDLANALKGILQSPSSVDVPTALGDYHRAMFQRGAKVIAFSTRNTSNVTLAGWKATLRDHTASVVFGGIKLWRTAQCLAGKSKRVPTHTPST